MVEATDLQTPAKADRRGTRKPHSLRFVLVICIVGVQFFSILTVIFLVYFAMDRAILQQSKDLLKQHSVASVERISSFFLPSLEANEMLVKLIENGTADFAQNRTLERILYGALRTLPEVSGFYFVRPDGSFIHLYPSEGSSEITTKWSNNPDQGTTFLVRDEGYMPIERYRKTNESHDPRKWAWYASATEAGTQIWTDIYRFSTTMNAGLTIAAPVYRNEELVGVFATDVELKKLGAALQADDHTARLTTSILSAQGELIARVRNNYITEFAAVDGLPAWDDTITKPLFERYQRTNVAFETKYSHGALGHEADAVLAGIRPLDGQGLKWLIATHAPQTALTGSLLVTQTHLLWMALLLFAITPLLAVPLADRIRRPVLNFAERSKHLAGSVIRGDPGLAAPYSELETTGQTIREEISKRRIFELQHERTFKISARGMARIDPINMRFLDVNARLCEMLGMPEKALLASGLDLVLAGDAQKTLDKFREAVMNDKEFKVEADFNSGENGIVPLRMTAFLMRGFEGHPDHAFSIFDDNEESKLSAALLENFKRDVDRIGRVNLMGQFATGLAHELNQPLGALVHDIDSAHFVLEETVIDRAELKEILTQIDDHAQRVGDIIRALRNMIEKDDQTPQTIHLRDLLDKTLAIMEPEARAYDVSIETRVAGNLLFLGNRVQIAQAFVNLLRNAIAALSSVQQKSRTVLIKAAENDGQIIISIEDNGPGFAPHVTPFVQFETTKADGLGLGLSISKSLVEANNGSILYKQAECGGALFEITLPGEYATTKRNGND